MAEVGDLSSLPDSAADLVEQIIAATRNGGITRALTEATYDVVNIVDFSEALSSADRSAYDALVDARRQWRPQTSADVERERLAANSDPETAAAFAELVGWPLAPLTDINAVLDGSYKRPQPEVMRRTDGVALLYRGRVHSIAGEPGGGKTWLALLAASQVLSDGGKALVLDYEDRLDTTVRRLAQLGTPHDDIRRLLYCNPTVAIKGGGLPVNIVDALNEVDLVIVDSMGEALAHSDLNQNHDGEVRSWMAHTARRLADDGAAVLLLDHVTKDADNRGRWAIGSQRKLAAIDGVAYTTTTLVAASQTQSGHVLIKCSKDRLGNFQHGAMVADVRIHPIDDSVDIVMDAPTDTTTESGEKLLTGYMERVSRLLEGIDGGLSKRAVLASVTGARYHLTTALQQLLDLGHIDAEKGPGGSVIHRVVKPFREDEFLLHGDSAAARRHRGGTAARRGGQTDEVGRGGAADPLGPPRRAPYGVSPSTHPSSDPTAAGSFAELDDFPF